MKKIIKLSLFLALTSLLITGCGKNNKDSTTESPVTPTDTLPSTGGGDTTGLDPTPTEYVLSYYQSISDTLSGDDLKTALYNLIHPKKCTTAYSAIWNYLPYCDAYEPDSSSSNKVTAFYRGTGGSQSEMNKEHVWPKSRGGHAIDGDPHMVRPTYNKDNSGRGNDFFNQSPTSYDPNEFGASQYRGICARIIFYCAVQEKDKLWLVDKTDDSTISTTTGSMGKLSTLLRWNLQYDVDWTEQLRNDVLSGQRAVRGKSWHFNRNPFIDHPSYACRIWGSTNSETRQICGM